MPYLSSHKVPKLCFGAFFLSCVEAPVNAGEHWWIDTRGEARVTVTDNALLTLTDRQTDVVLDLSPGLNMRWEGRRFTAGIDYAYDYLIFLSDGSTDERHKGFATLNAEVIEDHLTINGRANIRQQFLDQRGSITNNFANKTDNRRTVQNYTASALLKGGIRDFADWRVNYRLGLSFSPADNLDDDTLPVNFSDTTSHEIVASVGSGDRFNNFEWSIFLNSSRITRSLEVNDYLNENIGAELTYKFNRFFQVIGEAGYSRNDFQTSGLNEDGFSWRGGVRLTPGRKLDVTVLYGKEGQREVWSAQAQYFFTKRFDFSGTYSDRLSANTLVTNNSLQGFDFDEELGISNGAGLPIDETDPIFTLSDVDFRRQALTGTFSLRQKRTQMYLSGNWERRTFDDDTGTASSWGASYGFERNITERSTIEGSVGFRRSRFEGEARIDNYIEANLDWTTTLSRYFKAAIGFSHAERQSNEPGADLEENAITFYLRGTY